MKNVQSKILLTLIIIFFIIGFTTSAKSVIEAAYVRNGVTEPSETDGAANPLAVAYPSCLQQCRVQTIDFVKAFSIEKRDYIIHIFSKGKKYFPKAISVLTEYGAPCELQMIPVLESEFNANAVSPVGAVGYWQFMAELAMEYGLHTKGKSDERKNFAKSTVAAAKFFNDQLSVFNNDILLAVAAYNCGQGRVLNSLKKCKKTTPTFWDIKKYLPTETKRFVMNFVALNVIANNYEKFLNKEMDFKIAPYFPLMAAADCSDSMRISDSLVTVKPM